MRLPTGDPDLYPPVSCHLRLVQFLRIYFSAGSKTFVADPGRVDSTVFQIIIYDFRSLPGEILLFGFDVVTVHFGRYTADMSLDLDPHSGMLFHLLQ